MPYSPVTQPFPVPFKNEGTPSSTVAVQITRVFPNSISTLPSAWEMKSGVIFSCRIWSALRPSFLKGPPGVLPQFLAELLSLAATLASLLRRLLDLLIGPFDWRGYRRYTER